MSENTQQGSQPGEGLRRHRRRTAGLIVVLVTVSAVLILHLEGRPKQASRTGTLSNLFGVRSFDGRMLPAKLEWPLLVEIIDAEGVRAVQEVQQPARAGIQNRFHWIIITENPAGLSERAGISRDAFWVRMESVTAKRDFAEDQVGDQWMLFDSAGQLRSNGNFVHGGMIGELASLVDGTPAYSPQTVHLRFREIDRRGGFQSLRKIAGQSGTKRVFALLVHDASPGCGIADRIHEFDLAARMQESQYIILVPSEWNTNTIAALRANLDIANTRIESAGMIENAAWKKLIEDFGPFRTNGILLEFGSQGIVASETQADKVTAMLKEGVL